MLCLLIITFIFLALLAYPNGCNSVLLCLTQAFFNCIIMLFFILRVVASHRCWSPVATCLYMYIVCIESLINKNNKIINCYTNVLCSAGIEWFVSVKVQVSAKSWDPKHEVSGWLWCGIQWEAYSPWRLRHLNYSGGRRPVDLAAWLSKITLVKLSTTPLTTWWLHYLSDKSEISYKTP